MFYNDTRVGVSKLGTEIRTVLGKPRRAGATDFLRLWSVRGHRPRRLVRSKCPYQSLLIRDELFYTM